MSRVDSYASHPARMSAISPDSDAGADGNDSTTVGDGEGLRLGLSDGVGLTALGDGVDGDGPGTDGVHPTNSTKHTSR